MSATRQQALRIVNPVIGALFIIQAATGIFRAAIPYEVFSKLHGPAGFLLAAGVTAHIILNWNWFRSLVKKSKSSAAKA